MCFVKENVLLSHKTLLHYELELKSHYALPFIHLDLWLRSPRFRLRSRSRLLSFERYRRSRSLSRSASRSLDRPLIRSTERSLDRLRGRFSRSRPFSRLRAANVGDGERPISKYSRLIFLFLLRFTQQA